MSACLHIVGGSVHTTTGRLAVAATAWPMESEAFTLWLCRGKGHGLPMVGSDAMVGRI